MMRLERQSELSCANSGIGSMWRDDFHVLLIGISPLNLAIWRDVAGYAGSDVFHMRIW